MSNLGLKFIRCWQSCKRIQGELCSSGSCPFLLLFGAIWPFLATLWNVTSHWLSQSASYFIVSFPGWGEGVGSWTLAQWAWKPERCLAVKRQIQYTVAASFCSRHLEIRQKCACINVASSSIGEPWQIPSTSRSSQRLFLTPNLFFHLLLHLVFSHSIPILKPNLYRCPPSSKRGGVTFTYVNVGS